MTPDKRKKLQALVDDERTPENEKRAAQNALDAEQVMMPYVDVKNHEYAIRSIETKLRAEGVWVSELSSIDIDVSDQGDLTIRIRGRAKL